MPEFILEHRAEDGRCISDDVLSAFDEQDALIRYALATGSVAGTDRVCIGIKNTRNSLVNMREFSLQLIKEQSLGQSKSS